jgi:hypothetical protein
MTQALYAHMNNKRKKKKHDLIFLCVVLGIELQALHILGKYSTIENHSQTPTPFSETGSCRVALNLPNSPGWLQTPDLPA